MVEVFETDVQQVYQANVLLNELRKRFPDTKMNFDLDDCDRILRIEAGSSIAGQVRHLLNEKGYRCRPLE
jgi:hypothetical protein